MGFRETALIEALAVEDTAKREAVLAPHNSAWDCYAAALLWCLNKEGDLWQENWKARLPS
jgi:hypothetical protein